MKKFDKKIAQEYLDSLLNEYKIKVTDYSSSSCGKAYWKQRSIKIPLPTNIDRFGVCLHEVKHIIDGNKGSRFEQEFACDLYALNILKAFKYNTEAWERRMRWHCLVRIAMAVNRGLNINKISIEIRKFFKEVDFNDWRNKKVFVNCDKKYDNITISLTENLSEGDVEAILNRSSLMLSRYHTNGDTRIKWEVRGNHIDTQYYENLSDIVKKYKLSL